MIETKSILEGCFDKETAYAQKELDNTALYRDDVYGFSLFLQ